MAGRQPLWLMTVLVLCLLAYPAVAQDKSPDETALLLREAYEALKKGNLDTYEEYSKLIASCRERIAQLAGADPDTFLAAAKDILLDEPFLLESEKQRGTMPERLAVKGAIAGAVVLVGGEEAWALLEELAGKVESGEAEKMALGVSPADLLEVPVKFDRVIDKALRDGGVPPADLRNAVRFAQEHYVARILMAGEIPGLDAEEMVKLKSLAVERLRTFLSRTPKTPLDTQARRMVADVIGLEPGTQLPEDWHERLLKDRTSPEKEEPRQTTSVPETAPGMRLETPQIPELPTRPAQTETRNLNESRDSGTADEPLGSGVLGSMILLSAFLLFGICAVILVISLLRRKTA